MCSWLALSGTHTVFECTPQQPCQQSGPSRGRQQAATECCQQLRGCDHLWTAAHTTMHLPHGATDQGSMPSADGMACESISHGKCTLQYTRLHRACLHVQHACTTAPHM